MEGSSSSSGQRRSESHDPASWWDVGPRGPPSLPVWKQILDGTLLTEEVKPYGSWYPPLVYAVDNHAENTPKRPSYQEESLCDMEAVHDFEEFDPSLEVQEAVDRLLQEEPEYGHYSLFPVVPKSLTRQLALPPHVENILSPLALYIMLASKAASERHSQSQGAAMAMEHPPQSYESVLDEFRAAGYESWYDPDTDTRHHGQDWIVVGSRPRPPPPVSPSPSSSTLPSLSYLSTVWPSSEYSEDQFPNPFYTDRKFSYLVTSSTPVASICLHCLRPEEDEVEDYSFFSDEEDQDDDWCRMCGASGEDFHAMEDCPSNPPSPLTDDYPDTIYPKAAKGL